MAMRDPTTILPEEVKAELLRAVTACDEAMAFIELCNRAGMDVSEYKQRCESLRQAAQGMVRTFVSPRRRG